MHPPEGVTALDRVAGVVIGFVLGVVAGSLATLALRADGRVSVLCVLLGGVGMAAVFAVSPVPVRPVG